MKLQRFKINNIPAIIWGEKSDKVYIYVHGKMSCKEHAENFAEIAEKKVMVEKIIYNQLKLFKSL